MSAIRKPQAAPGAVRGWPGTSPTSRDSHRTLASLLEIALGSAGAANAAIAQALAQTGRPALPAAGPELLAFVRAHLLTSLSGEIGPRLTLALVDDLVALLDSDAAPASTHSSSGPASVAVGAGQSGSAPRVRRVRLAVLLVDADRVGRTTLARALLRADWNVTLIDNVADVLLALEDEAPIDAVLVDAAHPATQAIVAELVRSRPDIAVVARSGDSSRTRALLGPLALTRFAVCSWEAPAEELIDALKEATRE